MRGGFLGGWQKLPGVFQRSVEWDLMDRGSEDDEGELEGVGQRVSGSGRAFHPGVSTRLPSFTVASPTSLGPGPAIDPSDLFHQVLSEELEPNELGSIKDFQEAPLLFLLEFHLPFAKGLESIQDPLSLGGAECRVPFVPDPRPEFSPFLHQCIPERSKLSHHGLDSLHLIPVQPQFPYHSALMVTEYPFHHFLPGDLPRPGAFRLLCGKRN